MDGTRTRARRLALDVSPETLATFREAVGRLRRETETPLSDEAALLEMSRRILGGSEDAGEAGYAITLTVCPACGRGKQHGRGEVVAVDAAVVEQAQCDARCFEVPAPGAATPAEPAHVGVRAPSSSASAKARPRASSPLSSSQPRGPTPDCRRPPHRRKPSRHGHLHSNCRRAPRLHQNRIIRRCARKPELLNSSAPTVSVAPPRPYKPLT